MPSRARLHPLPNAPRQPRDAAGLTEIETDLQARRDRALAEGWLGEIEGIDLTMRLLREKQATAERIRANSATSGVVDLGMPRLVAAVPST